MDHRDFGLMTCKRCGALVEEDMAGECCADKVKPLGEDATEFPIEVSNFDGSWLKELPRISEAIEGQPGKVYVTHTAWGYCGQIWFDGLRFREDIYRHGKLCAEYDSESLEDLINDVRSEQGHD